MIQVRENPPKIPITSLNWVHFGFCGRQNPQAIISLKGLLFKEKSKYKSVKKANKKILTHLQLIQLTVPFGIQRNLSEMAFLY